MKHCRMANNKSYKQPMFSFRWCFCILCDLKFFDVYLEISLVYFQPLLLIFWTQINTFFFRLFRETKEISIKMLSSSRVSRDATIDIFHWIFWLEHYYFFKCRDATPRNLIQMLHHRVTLSPRLMEIADLEIRRNRIFILADVFRAMRYDAFSLSFSRLIYRSLLVSPTRDSTWLI